MNHHLGTLLMGVGGQPFDSCQQVEGLPYRFREHPIFASWV